MNTTAVLTNGREIMVRNPIIKAGTLVGYSTWTGRFIALVNVAYIR